VCTSDRAWASRGAGRYLPRTPMRKVGQASASLQAWVPWCASGTGLMRGMGRCTSEANDFRYSKRLAPFVKLATSYITQDMDD
jgi:hypothetical protein